MTLFFNIIYYNCAVELFVFSCEKKKTIIYHSLQNIHTLLFFFFFFYTKMASVIIIYSPLQYLLIRVYLSSPFFHPLHMLCSYFLSNIIPIVIFSFTYPFPGFLYLLEDYTSCNHFLTSVQIISNSIYSLLFCSCTIYAIYSFQYIHIYVYILIHIKKIRIKIILYLWISIAVCENCL